MNMHIATATADATIDAAVIALWADGVIEHHRYESDDDRVLALYEETDTVMPSADYLAQIGFDLVGLAQALEAGLDPVLFGKAYPMLDIAEFNVATAAGLDIALFNEGLDHLADMVAEARVH
jgi:hypothetical protein